MPGEPVSVWLVSNGGYWRAAWRDEAGVTRGRGLGSKARVSRREANVMCRRLAAELALPAAAARAAGVPRLSAWLDRYAGQRTDVSAKTTATYRYCGVYLRLYFDADPPIDRVTRADAADWRAAVASGELTRRLNVLARTDPDHYRNPAGREWVPPGPFTVAQFVRTAKLIFGAAVDQDLIGANPFAKLRGTAPAARRDWRDVTPADLSRILDACPSPPWRALFGLCRLAGLRVGECRRLRWADVNWAGNRLAVNATPGRETTKVRRRVCPIEPRDSPTGLTRILREAFEAAEPGSAGPCDGVPVNNLYRLAAGILSRAGVAAYAKPFHTLRKCRAVELAAAYPQHVACEWLGHGITVAAEHYLRVPAELFDPPPGVGEDFGRGIGRRPPPEPCPAAAPPPPAGNENAPPKRPKTAAGRGGARVREDA